MRRRVWWTGLVTALLFTGVLGLVSEAAVPKTEKEIPVIPGAVLDQAAAARWAEYQDPEATLLYSGARPFQIRSRYEKVYTVPGPIEDVFRFYQVQFGAKPLGDDGGPNPLDLAPGKTTPVGYDLYPYEDELTDVLSKNRKPYSPGKWIREVDFNWGRRESNGDLTIFLVRLEDWSFSEDWKSYKTKTLLVVHRETYVNDEEAGEAADAQEDEFLAEVAAQLAAAPPTEAVLGAPLYPGATFMPEHSAGMTMDNSYAMYIYFSLDPVEQVRDFYQRKTGKQAEAAGGNKYLFTLAGQPPVPDQGISLEPNQMFGGAWKTVLTFIVKRD